MRGQTSQAIEMQDIAVVEGVQSFSPIWLAGRPSWELPYLGHTYI